MSVDLGSAEILGAEAVGQPGQRRFRLYVQTAHDSAIMWMEKEQLNSLSLALDRFLAQVTEGKVLRIEAQVGGPSMKAEGTSGLPGQPDYDFQVGHMSINYDERLMRFMLSAVPLEISMEYGQEPQVVVDEEKAISFLFTHQQAQRLSSAIAGVISAGRPVCPLCRMPLDGGPHACIRQNGHREIVQVEEDDEEE